MMAGCCVCGSSCCGLAVYTEETSGTAVRRDEVQTGHTWSPAPCPVSHSSIQRCSSHKHTGAHAADLISLSKSLP